MAIIRGRQAEAQARWTESPSSRHHASASHALCEADHALDGARGQPHQRPPQGARRGLLQLGEAATGGVDGFLDVLLAVGQGHKACLERGRR